MAKPRHGEPDRFQTGGFAIDERPVSGEVAQAAVDRFVELFVIRTKRDRMRGGLLHRKPDRRREAMQHADGWIRPASRSTLEGNPGFPQHLHERFGDLRGVMIDLHAVRNVAVAGAAALSSGQMDSLFIADAARMAMVFFEVGAPTLCLAPTR